MTNKISLSNTGVSITISLSPEFYVKYCEHVAPNKNGYRNVDVVYDIATKQVLLRPNPHGRRIGEHSKAVSKSAYLGVQSKLIPHWPAHGKIDFPDPFIRKDGTIGLHLPETLPAPTPKKTSTSKVHENRTEYGRDHRKYAPEEMELPQWARREIGPEIDGLSALKENNLMPTEKTTMEILAEAYKPTPDDLLKDAVIVMEKKKVETNVSINFEGVPMNFNVPLRLRLKILSLLQADPNVSGDGPQSGE